MATVRKLPIRSLPIPKEKYGLKCPHALVAQSITVHNTWNTPSALAEASFSAGNDWEVSSHAYVDEKEVVLSVPFGRNAWHAGDGGTGKGNRSSICIEICRSRSDLALYKKAEDNGALYVAMLLHQKGWGINRVYKHQDWSGKYCPHRTLDLGWSRFLRMVESYLAQLKAPATKPTPKPTPVPKPKEEEVKPKWGVFPSNVGDLPLAMKVVSQVKGAVLYDRTLTPEEMFEGVVQIGGAKKLRSAYVHLSGSDRYATDAAVTDWIKKHR